MDYEAKENSKEVYKGEQISRNIPSTYSFEKNSLSLIAENFKEWIVDKKQFKGTIPKIVDMQISDNLRFFIDFFMNIFIILRLNALKNAKSNILEL